LETSIWRKVDILEAHEEQSKEGESRLIVTITATPFERLFLGSLRAAELLARANLLEMRSVVSVCREEVQSRGPKITYVHLPVLDAQFLPFGMVDEVMPAIA
jgi:hypothetical protein